MYLNFQLKHERRTDGGMKYKNKFTIFLILIIIISPSTYYVSSIEVICKHCPLMGAA